MRVAEDLRALALAAREAEAYRRGVGTAERTRTAPYAEMLGAFAAPLPETAGDGPAIIADLVARATPGLRATTGPRFYGWVIGQSHATGVAADWLTAAWGQNAGNLLSAPAAAAVETVAAGWLLDLLGLPSESSVGFVTGATVANFVCLAAARSAVLARVGWDVEADGLFGAPPITVLIGADAHATIYSGLKYLGLGASRVGTIACDEMGRIEPEAFAAALGECDGPIIAILQAGQINTGACDPFEALIPLAHAAGAWVHVDGAFGLWAQATPELAQLTAGVGEADSWGTDGHKWLQVPYDCAYAIVRDAQAHARAMAISASYLPAAADGEREPSAYVPELSRRARGFATWAMIRQLGRAGIAAMIETHHRIARHIGETLATTDGIDLVCPIPLNQLMLRFGDDDALTRATIAAVQADGVAFLGGAKWRGREVMRISVSSIATTMADADLTIDAIRRAWAAVQG